MSPRSEEFMVQARERAQAAGEILADKHLEVAVSVAYYAMLNAARAALSEDDAHARTHRGTWHLFHGRYVSTGAFDESLHSLATNAQQTRGAEASLGLLQEGETAELPQGKAQSGS